MCFLARHTNNPNKETTIKPYGGIDLHSKNNVIVILDEQDKVVYGHEHSNDMDDILPCLLPFRDIMQGLVVEPTFNWRWLVDALMDCGRKIGLDPHG